MKSLNLGFVTNSSTVAQFVYLKRIRPARINQTETLNCSYEDVISLPDIQVVRIADRIGIYSVYVDGKGEGDFLGETFSSIQDCNKLFHRVMEELHQLGFIIIEDKIVNY